MTDAPSRVPLSRPYFDEPVRRAIADDIAAILESGQLMLGDWARKFEDRFCEITGRAHAVSLTTCTTALQIALMHAGVKGGEVLVPAGSFITDVSAVEFAGATPVLVDMNPRTLALDLNDLKRKVTDRSRAVIWVHLTGIIADDHLEILEFASDRGLYVIEDAAHAHGAKYDGRPAGSFGDASTFSFYPTKVLTSGTGGMLTTDDADLATFAREMRVFGKQEGTGEIVHYGNDWFLDEIRACVAWHHTGVLEEQVRRRREIADIYERSLANHPGFRLLEVPPASEPAWYQYPVFLDPEINREALIATLRHERGIDTKGIYKPTQDEQIFRTLDDGTLGRTRDTLTRSLCLPMHIGISDALAKQIAGALSAEIRTQVG